MNIKAITNSFSNINFQRNENYNKSETITIPYSQFGKIATMAMLLSIAGCGKDTFIKDDAINADNYECCLHRPDTIRLTPEERKLEQAAQKIAGDYYEVEYLPQTKQLKLTAGDICENEYNDIADAYNYAMSGLKRGFALKNGAIVKSNPSLMEVNNQAEIEQTTMLDSLVTAVKNGRTFYSPNLNPENRLDEAILLPGQSLYISVKDIGQRLRYGQLPFKFAIFKEAAAKK